MEYELYHHGIKGMRWGIRRFQNKDGSLTSAGKKRYGDEDDKNTSETKPTKPKQLPEHIPKKQMKSMTAEELKGRIERLELEQNLRKLENTVYPQRGKKFVLDVLEKSGKNITEQLTTLAMGSAANKILQEVMGSFDEKYKKEQFVNPKKGQKDK